MAIMNDSNFDFFPTFRHEFFSFELLSPRDLVSFALFSSFAGAFCDRYDAHIRPYEVWKTRPKNTKELNNGGILRCICCTTKSKMVTS